tara:strand:- start:168 stop:1280 length:1113 start_codon:yes stop_codon:yes gene_type:complete
MSKAAELAKMGEVLTNSQIGGRRNIVINGAMQVSQRSTSVSSITATGYHALDRFKLLYTDAGTWTMSQSSTTPNGFANSLKLDCTSAKSSLASDSRLFLMTSIEGQDVQQFKKGTSDAETYTLSFHVRSNKTGTYQVNIEDNDNVRIVGSTYTISSADTWEKKEITFVADTTGAFADDNGDSLAIMWALVAGTDNSSGAVPTAWEAKSNTDRGAGLNINLADSTSNEWYITGVQLEVGSTATPFEHRSFGEELALCQRYFNIFGTETGNNFENFGTVVAFGTSAGEHRMQMTMPTTMRAIPSVGNSGNFATLGQVDGGGGTLSSIGLADGGSKTIIGLNLTMAGGNVVGDVSPFRSNNDADAFISFDAEL